MAGSVVISCNNNALVVENLSVIVVLLPAQIFKLVTIFLVFLYVIVSDVSISKKVLDFKCIKLLFGLDNLHWANLAFFVINVVGIPFSKIHTYGIMNLILRANLSIK